MSRWLKTIINEDSTGYKSVMNIDNCKMVIWNIETAKKIKVGDIIYVYVGRKKDPRIEYRSVVVDIISHNNTPKDKRYELQLAFLKLPAEISDELTYNKIKTPQPIVTRSMYLFSEESCKPIFDEIDKQEKVYYDSKGIKI